MPKSALWLLNPTQVLRSGRDYMAKSALWAQVTAKSHIGGPFGRSVSVLPCSAAELQLPECLLLHPYTSTAGRFHPWLAMTLGSNFHLAD